MGDLDDLMEVNDGDDVDSLVVSRWLTIVRE